MYCKLLKLKYNWCEKTSENFEECQQYFDKWYKHCWN